MNILMLIRRRIYFARRRTNEAQRRSFITDLHFNGQEKRLTLIRVYKASTYQVIQDHYQATDMSPFHRSLSAQHPFIHSFVHRTTNDKSKTMNQWLPQDKNKIATATNAI